MQPRPSSAPELNLALAGHRLGRLTGRGGTSALGQRRRKRPCNNVKGSRVLDGSRLTGTGRTRVSSSNVDVRDSSR